MELIEPWSNRIEDAPEACSVFAAYFDQNCGDWCVSVVMSPLPLRFTHWRMIDTPETPDRLAAMKAAGDGLVYFASHRADCLIVPCGFGGTAVAQKGKDASHD